MRKIDWEYIPESSEANLSIAKNYYVLLTKAQRANLERYLRIASREKLIEKRINAESSIIKLIIKNTYLYINNMESHFEEDLLKISSKAYYKDIDQSFIKTIKRNKKEYDFIKELVRNQMLKLLAPKKSFEDDDEELEKVQFRLAEEDSKDLLKIFSGCTQHSLPEYLTSYLNYFLSVSEGIRRKIIHYPFDLKLERAIKENRIIELYGTMLKPVKRINGFTLLAFNKNDGKFREIILLYRLNIIETEELFELNSYEKSVLEAYSRLDKMEAKFVIESSEKTVNDIIGSHGYNIISIEKDGIQNIITFKYSRLIIRKLEEARNRKEIKYLNYSDNYNHYLDLIKEE